MPISRLQRICFLAAFAACISGPAALADTPGNVTEARLKATLSDGTDWPVKGGNALGQHYSVLDDINADNVGRLGLAWSADIPVPDGVAATPIIVDGVVYVSAAWSHVFAFDAAIGEQLWHHDPQVLDAISERPDRSWTARGNRGIAVWGGKVFATTADCRLVALDAGTGKERWTVSTCEFEAGFSISDSPYVGGGKVFVGNGGSEAGVGQRGYVSAYSAADGRLLWRFYTAPSADPDENDTPAMKMAYATWSGDTLKKFGGGGHPWNEMTYDPETGLLFFGTSGAVPYVHALRAPDGGDTLFMSSVVAVHADTGQYAWHYQTVPKDSWDYNATMNIALGEFAIGGRERKTLLIAPKNGFHYVLDRLSGELLAADKFAKVNWASHVNLETGRPVYLPDAEFWTDDAAAEVAVWPNMWGAHNWQPMAWHPGLKLAYIPVIDVPSLVTGYDDGDFTDTIELVTEVDGRPHSPGKLVAFDPLAGKARWTVDHRLPFNGGVMATAGNLVFQGDAEGRFSAYAADTGERLWSVSTGSPISAAPATYTVGGTQYVVIPVGAGGGVQFAYPELHAPPDVAGPTRLMAFTLEGDARLPAPQRTARRLPPQPPLEATAEQIEAGQKLYAGECYGCHGSHGVARVGGTPPDLRYADEVTHAQWHGIVIGGARAARGMPAFELTPEESEAIRVYVLSRAAELRAAAGD